MPWPGLRVVLQGVPNNPHAVGAQVRSSKAPAGDWELVHEVQSGNLLQSMNGAIQVLALPAGQRRFRSGGRPADDPGRDPARRRRRSARLIRTDSGALSSRRERSDKGSTMRVDTAIDPSLRSDDSVGDSIIAARHSRSLVPYS